MIIEKHDNNEVHYSQDGLIHFWKRSDHKIHYTYTDNTITIENIFNSKSSNKYIYDLENDEMKIYITNDGNTCSKISKHKIDIKYFDVRYVCRQYGLKLNELHDNN